MKQMACYAKASFPDGQEGIASTGGDDVPPFRRSSVALCSTGGAPYQYLRLTSAVVVYHRRRLKMAGMFCASRSTPVWHAAPAALPRRAPHNSRG